MNKIKVIGILAVLIAFVGIQVIAAQQANDYRAFVYGYSNVLPVGDGNNATMTMRVAYVPVYPDATYTFQNIPLENVRLDFSQPTKINDQIATAVKVQGESFGYNVIRVFIPAYEMKIP